MIHSSHLGKRIALAACAVSLFGIAGITHADPRYSIQRLSPISSEDLLQEGQTLTYNCTCLHSSVNLNNRGDVIIDTTLYHRGHHRELKFKRVTLEDGYVQHPPDSTASNDHADIVATIQAVADGAWLIEWDTMVLLKNGKQTILPDPTDIDGVQCMTGPINNREQIVEYGSTQHPDSSLDRDYAYVYNMRTRKFINYGEGAITAINDLGDVIYNNDLIRVRHGVKEEVDFEKAILSKVKKQPHYTYAVDATAVNNHDVVIGDAQDLEPDKEGNYGIAGLHAFLWNHGRSEMFGLQDVYSTATAVNDSNEVVGNAQLGPVTNGLDISTYPFLYISGNTYNLNTLIPHSAHHKLTEALAINKSGQIVAAGERSFYLLTPR